MNNNACMTNSSTIQTRYEFKYFITYEKYELLRGLISAIMPRDLYSQKANDYKYPVFSQYYDTPNREFLWQKVEGEYYHSKLRLRKYTFNFNDDSPAYLESKVKQGPVQKKLRFKLDSKEDQLDLPSEFVHLLGRNQFLPACKIFYMREAFQMETIDKLPLRINFDSSIIACDNDQNIIDEKVLFKNNHFDHNENFDKVLLEVKYSKKDLPEFLMSILRSTDCIPESFSKYTLGMKFLKPINTSY
jgi:hypothetical protein